MTRAMTPTERDAFEAVKFPITVAQVQHLLSKKRGEPVSQSTVTSSLRNLAQSGRVVSEWQTRPQGGARRRIYRPKGES